MIAALEKARAPLVLLPGTVEQRLTSAIRARQYNYPVSRAADMSDAVQRAYRIAQSDPSIQVVLLSPGFSGHSVFINEFDRGRQFCAAADEICQG